MVLSSPLTQSLASSVQTASASILHQRDEAHSLLRQVWGYPEFRYPQGEIIQTLLTGEDALVVLPTGQGKSLCFQVPALLQRGVTLVITPLIALMENQVQELRDRGLAAATLHSQMSKSDRRQVLQQLERQQLRLLYLAPETLFSSAVWSILCLPYLKINGLILDEAHCLVQWGDSFRPAYDRLGAVRPELLRHKPAGTRIAIAAFTATATLHDQAILSHSLGLHLPRCFQVSPYRSNLNPTVQWVWTQHQRRQALLKALRRWTGQSGLVYVRTRRECEDLTTWLQQQGLWTLPYHAGLSSRDRRDTEQAWLSDRLPFVVCTNAFGLGINKPNTRWVIHYHMPSLLTEYLQEIGRAGRDGLPAEALALVSEPTGWLDPSDRQRHTFFQEQLQQQQRQAQHLAQTLPPQGELPPQSSPDRALALAHLHRLGQLTWLDPFHYQIQATPPKNPSAVNSPAVNSPLAAPNPITIRQFLYRDQCRWQMLLRAFGFDQEATQFACGHCDRCRQKGVKPRTITQAKAQTNSPH